MIEAVYKCNISFHTLQSFYRSNAVNYKTCKAVYRTYVQRQP